MSFAPSTVGEVGSFTASSREGVRLDGSDLILSDAWTSAATWLFVPPDRPVSLAPPVPPLSARVRANNPIAADLLSTWTRLPTTHQGYPARADNVPKNHLSALVVAT